MPASNQKAAVYFRCSTDKQDRSIQDQRTVIVEYARNHSIEITAWFDGDEGKSGTSFVRRPDFMRMVKTVESRANNFSVILVYDIDRWGRPTDPSESGYWDYHFVRHGVRVIYISDQSVNDPSMLGRLSKNFKQELASEESRKQSVRVHERSRLRAAEGFRVGGFAPYGYKRLLVDSQRRPIRTLEDGERKVEKTQRVVLIPGDSGEIEVIKRIFNMRMQGLGIRAIANNLNADHVLTPGHRRVYSKPGPGKWCIGTIWKILRSPVYKGDWVYDEQIRGSWTRLENPSRSKRDADELVTAKSAHDPIIDPGIWNQVNSTARPRNALRASGMSYRSRYLLSGLLKCKHCGYNFNGHTRTVQGRKYGYYEDSGFNLHGSEVCSQTMIAQKAIEAKILAVVNQKLPQITNRKRVMALLKSKIMVHENGNPGEKGELEKKVAEQKVRLERLKDAIEQGVDVNTIKDRLKSCQTKLESLEGELSRTQDPAEDIDFDKLVAEILESTEKAVRLVSSTDPHRIKDGLRALIYRIEVEPTTRIATCFIPKFPGLSMIYGDDLPVSLCRRSESNRHVLANGGF